MQLNRFSTPKNVFIVHLLILLIYSADFSKTNCKTNFEFLTRYILTLLSMLNIIWYIGKAFMHSSLQLEFLE